jgi:protein TonB
VAESSGHEDLDDAARAAASDWTFAPALEDGEPVAGTLRVPVRFELTD